MINTTLSTNFFLAFFVYLIINFDLRRKKTVTNADSFTPTLLKRHMTLFRYKIDLRVAPTLMCLINGGRGIIIVLALENQKNNRPKTKNYITEGPRKIKNQEVAPPQLLGTRE